MNNKILPSESPQYTSFELEVLGEDVAFLGLPDELVGQSRQRLEIVKQQILAQAQAMWVPVATRLVEAGLELPAKLVVRLTLDSRRQNPSSSLDLGFADPSRWGYEQGMMYATLGYGNEDKIRKEARLPKVSEVLGVEVIIPVNPLYGPGSWQGGKFVPLPEAKLSTPVAVFPRLVAMLGGSTHELVHCFERYYTLRLAISKQDAFAVEGVVDRWPFDTILPTFLLEGSALINQGNFLRSANSGRVWLPPINSFAPQLLQMTQEMLTPAFFGQAYYNQFNAPFPMFDPYVAGSRANYDALPVTNHCLFLALLAYCSGKDVHNLNWLPVKLEGKDFSEEDIAANPSLLEQTRLSNLFDSEVTWDLLQQIWGYYLGAGNIQRFVELIKQIEAVLPVDPRYNFTCALYPGEPKSGQADRYQLFNPGGEFASFNDELVNNLLSGANVQDLIALAVRIAHHYQSGLLKIKDLIDLAPRKYAQHQ